MGPRSTAPVISAKLSPDGCTSTPADRGPMELADTFIEEQLDQWPVARLATVGPDGCPRQVPIVFARVGETIWSPIDGKPKSDGELARVRHLRARPEASLLIDEYTPDWRRLWWIALDVRGRVVAADAPSERAAADAAVAALRDKYAQYDSVEILSGRPTLLCFRILRTRGWRA